jgi:hypothetical protein
MTLGELEPAVVTYLKIDDEVTPYSGDGFNLFVMAANNARKLAERATEWNHLKTRVRLEVNALNGVALSTAKLLSDNTTVVDVNQILSACIYDPDTKAEMPIDLVEYSEVISELRQQTEKSTYPMYGTSDDLPSIYPYMGPYDARRCLIEQLKLARFGDQIYIEPKGLVGDTVHTSLYVVRWATKYPTTEYDDVEDYFLKHLEDYMLWSTICEMNHLVKEFNFRQEGNVQPPTTQRDTALQAALINEGYSTVMAGQHYK